MSASDGPSQRLVLVVDDNADLRDLLSEIVRREGFRVCEANDGAEALELLAELAEALDAPHLILLDLMMPVMDGGTFIGHLRAKGDRTPIVVLTASGLSVVPGAELVMAKPVQPERLRDVVHRYAAA